MAEPFEFSEMQAVDILDMQLRQLTRLSRIDLETELGDSATASPRSRRSSTTTHAAQVIKDEMLAIHEEFATDRVSARSRSTTARCRSRISSTTKSSSS